MKRLQCAIGTLLWFVIARGVSAGNINEPAALLDRAFQNLYDSNYIQSIEMTVESSGLRPISTILQIIRKQDSRPGKALIRFLQPYDVRRTAILILENRSTADDFYVYLPAARMTRRISAAQRSDAFFGSDLTFEDIEPKSAEDYSTREAQYKVRNGRCVGVEAVPAASVSSGYEKMVFCIDPTDYQIHGIDFYRNGRLQKQLDVEISSSKYIAGKVIPFLMTMTSLDTGSKTTIATKSYEVVGQIPESIFTARNLETGDPEKDRSRLMLEAVEPE